MSLSAIYFNHAKELLKLSAEQIVYKCLISLGDVARYRLMNQQSKQKRIWAEPWSWYEKAIELNCNGGIFTNFGKTVSLQQQPTPPPHPMLGKPFLQLAILSSYKQEPIDVLYYNCLGLGNVEPSLNAKSNLVLYLQQRKAVKNNQAKVETNAELDHFLLFFLEALNFDEVDVASMLASAKAPHLALLPTERDQYLVKMATCLIILLHDLDVQFVRSANTQSKQTIRNTQALVLNLLFTLSIKCMEIVLDNLETPEHYGNATEAQETSRQHRVLESSHACALVMMYISLNYSHLLNFTSYGKLLDHKFFTAVSFSRMSVILKRHHLIFRHHSFLLQPENI